MQRKTSLEELEKIYARNKNFSNKPDLEFDKLKISKDELKAKSDPIKIKKESDQEYLYNDGELIHSRKKKDEYIEMRTFLPTVTEKMISSRYENPLSQLKTSTKRWKLLTMCLSILGLFYLLQNFLVVMYVFGIELPSIALGIIEHIGYFVVQMQDILFKQGTITMIMDAWGIVIYVIVIIMLLKENTENTDKEEIEESGQTNKTLTKIFNINVLMFGSIYLAGTLYTIYDIYHQIIMKELIPLIIFHFSKIIFLLMNIFAFRRYKANKYVYEDLLLEALGSSDSEEDNSQIEDNHDQFGHAAFPSYT